MISSKDEYSIRSSYPKSEAMKTPLELLIEKEEPLGFIQMDAEMVVFLGDFARDFPNKWPTIREYIRDGGAGHKELASRLKVSPRTIKRHLNDLRTEAEKWNNPTKINYEVQNDGRNCSAPHFSMAALRISEKNL